MFAAHFAAGLAIKSGAPKAPTWALLTGAFLPDFAWIVLAAAGVEPTEPARFFDDWSHSLAMVVAWATLFALIFWRRGRAVVLAVWLAVFSHFLLDLPIHPKNLALYPHSSAHLGWNLWKFGATKSWLGTPNYWWIQLGVLLVLGFIYVRGMRRTRLQPNLILATFLFLVSLHLLML